MAAPNGLIVGWPSTVASIPAGWTRVTAADGRYIKASVTMGSTGGGNTHTHTPTAHTHTGAGHLHVISFGSQNVPGNLSATANVPKTAVDAVGAHTHADVNSGNGGSSLSADTPGTSNSGGNEPNRHTVIWIKSDGSTDVPVGALMWWTGSVAPTNHAICDGAGGTTDLRNVFLKGAAAAADGGSSSSASAHTHTYAHTHPIASHSHTAPSVSGVSSSGSANISDGANAFDVVLNHQHFLGGSLGANTGTSASDTTASDGQTPDPPFLKIHHLKKTGATTAIPTGTIALINSGAVPTGWITCNGANGTPALNDAGNPYVKGANGNGELLTTGGALTHTHTVTSHSHGEGTHVHTGVTLSTHSNGIHNYLISAIANSLPDHQSHAVTIADASGTTSDAQSIALTAQNNEPAYYTAQYIQSIPTSVTSPDTRGINVNFTEVNTIRVIPNSNDTSGINVNFTEVSTVFALEATLLDPASLDVETNSIVPVAWSLAGGTQSAYRVIVWSVEGPTFDWDSSLVVYDSGTIVSATANTTIPSGALETNTTYWIQVLVTDSRGLVAGTDHVEFSTNWAPATNVTGVTLRVEGGCGESDLPGFILHWNQVVPQGSESFLYYAVKRREVGAANWTMLEQITTIATLTYADYAVKSAVTYEYSIVWHANDPIAGELVSMDQDPLTRGYVLFDYIFLHEYDDPTKWLRLESMSIEDATVQDATLGRAWGRTRPTLFVGEAFYRHWQIRLMTALRRSPARLAMLRSLQSRQETGSRVLVLRFGLERSLYFSQIISANASLSQASWEGQIELTEVHYEEGLIL